MTEALLEKLQYLTWDERRALHFLNATAGKDDYVYHPEGRSVSLLVAHALDCHVSTAYMIVIELRSVGLIMTDQHPPALKRKKNHGHCICMMADRDALRSPEALAILRYPPGAERWLGFNPLQVARAKA